MRAVVISKQGNPVTPNIACQPNWPDLAVTGRGEVRIKTLASALNHMDLWVGRGVPGLDLDYPRISGCDACGVVEAVGDDVDPNWVGKRVIVNAATRVPQPVNIEGVPGSSLAPEYELIGEHHQGMHAEAFLMPADNLAPVHDDCDPKEAAAFGLTMLTAYSMMFTKGQLVPGQSVLVTGIGGGVATSALALAKHRGCPVIVTSRHQWKLDKALELGADHAILDEGQDWSRDVRKLTDKRGVDMVVDSTGKATHMNCIKSLARGGAYVTPGCTTGPDATTDLARLFWNQLRLLGSTMGSNEEFREVVSLFRSGHLRGVVDQVFKPEEASKAWERLEASEQFGKVVIDWS